MKQKLSFFGFEDEPFRLTPDADFYYPSSTHEKTIKLLNYFLEDGDGFAMLIGAPGTGKTTLLRKFLEGIPDNWEFALIVTSMLSPSELMRLILTDLGIEGVSQDLAENLKIFQDYVIELAEKGKKLLLIIDEAQSLPVESLEQIRLLSNIEFKDKKPLQIILSGQPELEKMVESQITQLNHRITVRCYLEHLNRKETEEYIMFRMAKANGSVKIEKKALDKLYKVTEGIPRLINSVMKRALVMAYSESRKYITKDDIDKATQSLGLKGKGSTLQIVALGVAFAIVIAIVIFVVLRYQ